MDAAPIFNLKICTVTDIKRENMVIIVLGINNTMSKIAPTAEVIDLVDRTETEVLLSAVPLFIAKPKKDDLYQR